jgi:hypothetical protein
VKFCLIRLELCSHILKDHGFTDTAALYDEAQVLCDVKAKVLEDIDRHFEDFRKSVEQSGDPQAKAPCAITIPACCDTDDLPVIVPLIPQTFQARQRANLIDAA